MNKFLFVISFIFISLFHTDTGLAKTKAKWKPETPKPGQAIIYIYSGKGKRVNVNMDMGKKFGATLFKKSKDYIKYTVWEGRYWFELTDIKRGKRRNHKLFLGEAIFEVKAGKVYYFKTNPLKTRKERNDKSKSALKAVKAKKAIKFLSKGRLMAQYGVDKTSPMKEINGMRYSGPPIKGRQFLNYKFPQGHYRGMIDGSSLITGGTMTYGDGSTFRGNIGGYGRKVRGVWTDKKGKLKFAGYFKKGKPDGYGLCANNYGDGGSCIYKNGFKQSKSPQQQAANELRAANEQEIQKIGEKERAAAASRSRANNLFLNMSSERRDMIKKCSCQLSMDVRIAMGRSAFCLTSSRSCNQSKPKERQTCERNKIRAKARGEERKRVCRAWIGAGYHKPEKFKEMMRAAEATAGKAEERAYKEKVEANKKRKFARDHQRKVFDQMVARRADKIREQRQVRKDQTDKVCQANAAKGILPCTCGVNNGLDPAWVKKQNTCAR